MTIWPASDPDEQDDRPGTEARRLLDLANRVGHDDPDHGAAILLGSHVNALLGIEAALTDAVAQLGRIARVLERGEVGRVRQPPEVF